MAKCACCRHPEHLQIMRLHAFGTPLRELSERFGLHYMTIHRCWTRHVSAEVKASFALGPQQLKDLAKTVAEEDGSRLDFLKLLRRYLLSAVQREYEAGNTPAMTGASKALRDVLDDIGRLNGEVLHHGSLFGNVTVNATFHDDPRFSACLTGLMDIGRQVPDAMPLIIALMRKLQGDAAPMIEGHANAA